MHPQAAPRPPADDGITMLTGKKDKIGGAGPAIPDFLRMEPDEQAKRMQEVKGKLVSALQPTPGMIAKIGQDPTLLAGGEIRCLAVAAFPVKFSLLSLVWFIIHPSLVWLVGLPQDSKTRRSWLLLMRSQKTRARCPNTRTIKR